MAILSAHFLKACDPLSENLDSFDTQKIQVVTDSFLLFSSDLKSTIKLKVNDKPIYDRNK